MLIVDWRINHTNNDKINLFTKTNIKIIPKKIEHQYIILFNINTKKL